MELRAFISSIKLRRFKRCLFERDLIMAIYVILFVICALVGESRGFTSYRRVARHSKDTCDVLAKFLENKNVTNTIIDRIQDLPHHNTICGGRCCDKEMEDQLREQAKEDFHNQIHHHSTSLLGLLATTADALRETVTTLARQSENKTLNLFSQVYRAMSLQSKPSITNLYQAMVDYVSPLNTNENLQQRFITQDMLNDRFSEFFHKLFPIAYHRAIINPNHNYRIQQDFSEKFKNCLYKTMDEIEPFGDIPKQIVQSLAKSLEATRVLIQALTLGKSILEKSDSLLFSPGSIAHQDVCYKALFRMSHCPKCRGVEQDARACRGFCTNVMRGCLTKPASELDFAWSEYIETVERLVVTLDGHNDPLGLNAEKAVRHLDSRISDAVMHAMEKGAQMEEKVRKVCGRAELVDSPMLMMMSPKPMNLGISSSAVMIRSGGGGGGTGTSSGNTFLSLAQGGPNIVHPPTIASLSKPPNQLHVQLGNFLASVVRSRTFYGTLADAICDDYPEAKCWNGERIGEYAKTVVDPTLTSQKYNPEFTLSASNIQNDDYVNPNTSVLIDQLRHIKQVVQSQLMIPPDSSALLADEAFEGSGSGDKPAWSRGSIANSPGLNLDTDDEDDGDSRDDTEGSGSGMGPSVIDDISIRTVDVDTIGSGSTIVILPGMAFVIACFVLAV